MPRYLLVFLSALLGACTFAQTRDLGRVTLPAAAEVSGIVASRTYPGVFWIHNDSGDEARLFAIRADGTPIIPPFLSSQFGDGSDARTPWPGIAVLGASNVDWEDIALMDGRLYVADAGNNGNARRDLGIYVINEPNPESTDRIRALKFIPIRYPNQDTYPAQQWHFDSEALFTDRGRLYLLTKHRQAGKIAGWEPGTNLYRLDSVDPNEENVLTALGGHAGVTLATAADISPNGEQLAVLCYQRLWVFARPADGSDQWLAGEARVLDMPILRTGQAEAITWIDNDTMLIGSENRGLFEMRTSELKPYIARPNSE